MALATDLTRFVCLFHDAGRASAAVRALEDLNLAPGAVQTIGDGPSATGLTGSQSLTELGVPDRDVEHLQDGLRHGGVVVSLEAPESRTEEIERIFHKYSADKIDESEFQSASSAGAAAPLAAAPLAAMPLLDEGQGQVVTGDAVVPVAQEELLVGKREVDRGGVRVYRRTVAEPVQQDVNLHGERVVLEYREVNRPVTDADLRAGTQEIELVETAEVPVVEKVARVVEEVRVGRVETDRTETIEDTVRHTEVDVQPLNGREPGYRE
jgi:uncharacterized protein (TIGR02271 family)